MALDLCVCVTIFMEFYIIINCDTRDDHDDDDNNFVLLTTVIC